ncbi:MAG: 4-amino-4-deoxy-L-arabinose transferase-like glycosyltransferase [Yoonia sp.]|jgi:4-amino-4-deoxy-L-arabinose transferase-like glycosyltransferase
MVEIIGESLGNPFVAALGSDQERVVFVGELKRRVANAYEVPAGTTRSRSPPHSGRVSNLLLRLLLGAAVLSFAPFLNIFPFVLFQRNCLER